MFHPENTYLDELYKYTQTCDKRISIHIVHLQLFTHKKRTPVFL